MKRTDLYTTVHKGLRALLFETAGLVARTEFARAEEVAPALERVRKTLRFLREHAGKEDRFIVPELRRLEPELAASLERTHHRLEALEAEIASLAERIEREESARTELGRELHANVNVLVALHVEHMSVEESAANRALWNGRSDEQLLALQRAVIGSIPALELGDWIELMLPALNFGERVELVRALFHALPPPAFDASVRLARRAVGDVAWNDLFESVHAARAEVAGGVR